MGKKLFALETFFYTAISILCLIGFIYFLLAVIQGNMGSIIGLIFTLMLGGAGFYQSYINIMDKKFGPQTLIGKIDYIWKSHGLFSMGKSSYFKINNKIFLIQNELIKDIPKETKIKIIYMPFSKTIISLERIK